MSLHTTQKTPHKFSFEKMLKPNSSHWMLLSYKYCWFLLHLILSMLCAINIWHLILPLSFYTMNIIQMFVINILYALLTYSAFPQLTNAEKYCMNYWYNSAYILLGLRNGTIIEVCFSRIYNGILFNVVSLHNVTGK